MTRKPLQGVMNIIRFNRHFYLLFVAVFVVLVVVSQFVPPPVAAGILAFTGVAVLGTVLSMVASWYIYDHSDLYRLHWLDGIEIPAGAVIANINAGFDETSAMLAAKYPEADIHAYDFYDPVRHTEIAITRARKAYPPYPGTAIVTTSVAPFRPSSVDVVFAILTVHEIRDTAERARFFELMKAGLKPGGRMIVVEHQRNLANFVAYNIGFFHFFSFAEWKRTFSRAGLRIGRQFMITPFVRTFILQ